jgi:hypothetical protein
MANKNADDLFTMLRARGLRKKLAKSVAALEGNARRAGAGGEKLARQTVDDLTAAAETIRDRVLRRDRTRSQAARKAGQTRKRSAAKRSAAAQKAGQTRKRSAAKRSAAAQKAGQTRKRTAAKRSAAAQKGAQTRAKARRTTAKTTKKAGRAPAKATAKTTARTTAKAAQGRANGRRTPAAKAKRTAR